MSISLSSLPFFSPSKLVKPRTDVSVLFIFCFDILIFIKLLESPTFHELVYRTDAFYRSMRQAAIEKIQDNERPPSRQAEVNPETKNPPRPSPTAKSKASESSRHDADECLSFSSSATVRTVVVDPDVTFLVFAICKAFSRRNNPTHSSKDDARAETERKLKELLQKLRDQKPPNS